MARFAPMVRVRGTIGVVQNRPIFTPGQAKLASSTGHHKIPGRGKLTSGGSGDAVDGGDHGLG